VAAALFSGDIDEIRFLPILTMWQDLEIAVVFDSATVPD